MNRMNCSFARRHYVYERVTFKDRKPGLLQVGYIYRRKGPKTQ